MRIRNVVSCAVIVAAMASAVVPAPVAGAATAKPTCVAAEDLVMQRVSVPQQYLLVGMRGSGEPLKSSTASEMGARVDRLYGSLQADPRFRNRIACVYVSTYQAMPVPELGTSEASRKALRAYIMEATTSYITLKVPLERMMDSAALKDKQFILAGYSQGASATRMAVSEVLAPDPARVARTKAVILIADPMTSPTDEKVGLAGWKTPTTGILTAAAGSGGTMSDNSIALTRIAINALPLLGRHVPASERVKLQKVAALVDTAFTSSAIADRFVLDRTMTSAQLRTRGLTVLSVCRDGDVVCSLFGQRGVIKLPVPPHRLEYPTLSLDMGKHTNAYTAKDASSLTVWTEVAGRIPSR